MVCSFQLCVQRADGVANRLLAAPLGAEPVGHEGRPGQEQGRECQEHSQNQLQGAAGVSTAWKRSHSEQSLHSNVHNQREQKEKYYVHSVAD
jgi:hypothetical protein